MSGADSRTVTSEHRSVKWKHGRVALLGAEFGGESVLVVGMTGVAPGSADMIETDPAGASQNQADRVPLLPPSGRCLTGPRRAEVELDRPHPLRPSGLPARSATGWADGVDGQARASGKRTYLDQLHCPEYRSKHASKRESTRARTAPL
jgi:hypothetical protein